MEQKVKFKILNAEQLRILCRTILGCKLALGELGKTWACVGVLARLESTMYELFKRRLAHKRFDKLNNQVHNDILVRILGRMGVVPSRNLTSLYLNL